MSPSQPLIPPTHPHLASFPVLHLSYRRLQCVIRTASDDSCGGGLGTRLPTPTAIPCPHSTHIPTHSPTQAEQIKQAAIISSSGDSQAAQLLSNAFQEAGDGLIELRRLEAAEEIAGSLSRSRNVAYLPGSGQNLLLSIPP